MKFTKDEFISLLSNCVLYKIRSNVRMIIVDCKEGFSWIKMYCYLDTLPVEKDKELVEDAIALFISYGDNYEENFDLSIQFSNKSFKKLSYTGKFVMYARYEEGILQTVKLEHDLP